MDSSIVLREIVNPFFLKGTQTHPVNGTPQQKNKSTVYDSSTPQAKLDKKQQKKLDKPGYE